MPNMWKILVIEDDDTVRDVLHSFLVSRKFDVSLAENGETTLGSIWRAPKSLISF